MTIDDLVKREGLYYKQFTDAPFTGKVTGNKQGALKSGKKEGAWVSYWETGQVQTKGNYKNGKKEGAWVRYHANGGLMGKSNYKNGSLEGAGLTYYDNGQLWIRSNFKNNKREGAWITYRMDGTVNKAYSGTYKNGVKISDWVLSKLIKG